MKGFPKFVNNRADLDALAGLYPSETRAFIQDILEFKDVWMSTGQLADGDDGVTDDTHKVVEVKDQAGVVTARYQYELVEDLTPNGPIRRFGFADGAQMQAYLQQMN